MFHCVEKYTNIRGFDFQPDWGATGVSVWLKFDAKRYRDMIQHGKKCFPKMNTLRILFSVDAWCENKDVYLNNIAEAAKIITEEKLQFIPVYFNGWFGLPSFGGFTPEVLQGAKAYDDYQDYRNFLIDSYNAIAKYNILMHDISNEPFNNAWGDVSRTEIVLDFIKKMCNELKNVDSRPITVGSQMAWHEDNMNMETIVSKFGDVDLLQSFIDVITLHPYCIPPMTEEEHEEILVEMLEYADKIQKDVIITECCWAGITDEDRIKYLEIEIPHFKKYNVGYMPHGLWTSPVADLHPIKGDGEIGGAGLYMGFIDKNGNVRKGHKNVFE